MRSPDTKRASLSPNNRARYGGHYLGMKMATRKKNWIKAKIWNESMTVDLEGPLLGSVVHVFIMLGSKEAREKVLDEMQKAHIDMCEREQAKSEAA